MSARANRFIFIHTPGAPPPEQLVCGRIATNQIGPIALTPFLEPLPNTPGSGTWEGQTSLATGTHQDYRYEEISAGVAQQYLVMSTVSGSFINGESLVGTPA